MHPIFFFYGKKYLEADDRYSHIYRKDESLINNFKHIIRWYASLQPLDAPFKMVVIDDAQELTRDAQSSLRRTMERYSRTCRFILCTTHPAAIIPAIASRCVPFFFGPVAPDCCFSPPQGNPCQGEAGILFQRR